MAKRRKDEYWIQDAIKRPGALTARARRAGAITERGTIRVDWLHKEAKKPGRPGRQARLALNMRTFDKNKKKR